MSALLDQYGQPMPSQAERSLLASEREDAWANPATGIGVWGQDKTKAATYLPVWRVLDQELTSLMNGSDIARKIVFKRADEMFRRGFEIEADNVNESQRDTMREFATEHLALERNLRSAKRWGRGYGGCLLLMGIDDGRYPWEPLDEGNIREFYSLSLVDRRYAYVQSQYAQMGTSSQYGNANVYLISNAVAGYGWEEYGAQKIQPKSASNLMKQGAQVALVHESRVLRFDGNEADVVTRQNLAGWSWSVLQVVYEALRQFEGSFDSTMYLLSDASQAVYKLQGLLKAITSGNRASLAMRLQLLEQSRSVMHGIALDAGEKDGRPTESFERAATPFGGIADLLDKMMLRMASAADMPATELWGRAPAGLNATGESDTRKWYDTIESEQKNDLGPQIKRIFKLLGLAKKGPLKGKDIKWKVKFHPLWAPSDKEMAESRLADAQRDQIYIDEGCVKPEEVALNLTEIYPNMDVQAREAALKAAVMFDPYENEPAPQTSAIIASQGAGEPLSPSAPVALMGTSGTNVSKGDLPAVAAAEQQKVEQAAPGAAGVPEPKPAEGGGKPVEKNTPPQKGATASAKGKSTDDPTIFEQMLKNGTEKKKPTKMDYGCLESILEAVARDRIDTWTVDDWDEEKHPRDGGKFASAPGSGSPKDKSGKSGKDKSAKGKNGTAAKGPTVSDRAKAWLSKSSGDVKAFFTNHEVRTAALSHAAHALRAAPGAVGKAAIEHVKGQIKEVKTAFVGIGHALTGKKVSDEEKKAIHKVAVKVAAHVAAGALIGIFPAAILHGPVGEKVAERVIDHVVDHVLKHLVGHVTGLSLDAAAALDPEDWLGTRIASGVADALEGMTDDDFAEMLEEIAKNDADEDEGDGDKDAKKDAIDDREAMAKMATEHAASLATNALTDPSPASHKAAGEAHLAAADANAKAGRGELAAVHYAWASISAKSAGDAWDQDQHPYSAEGVFDGGVLFAGQARTSVGRGAIANRWSKLAERKPTRDNHLRAAEAHKAAGNTVRAALHEKAASTFAQDAETQPVGQQGIAKVSAVPSGNVYEGHAALVIVWNNSDRGEILCVSRPEPPYEFAIPGGHIEPGETVSHAACREVLEETGIVARELRSNGTIFSPVDGRVVHVFTAGDWEGVARAAEDGTRYAWLTPMELLSQAEVYRESVLELMMRGALRKPLAVGGGGGSPANASSNFPESLDVALAEPRNGTDHADRRARKTPRMPTGQFDEEDATKASKEAAVSTERARTGQSSDAHFEAAKDHGLAAAAHRGLADQHQEGGRKMASAKHHMSAAMHESAAAHHMSVATTPPTWAPGDPPGAPAPQQKAGLGTGSLGEPVGTSDHADASKQDPESAQAAAAATEAANAATEKTKTDPCAHPDAVKAHALAAKAQRTAEGAHASLGNKAGAARFGTAAQGHDRAAGEHAAAAAPAQAVSTPKPGAPGAGAGGAPPPKGPPPPLAVPDEPTDPSKVPSVGTPSETSIAGSMDSLTPEERAAMAHNAACAIVLDSDDDRPDGKQAKAVFQQLLDDYPVNKLGWILGMHWHGPVEIPLDQIDTENRDKWRASHDGKLESFKDKIKDGVRKPAILVKTPGSDKYIIVDGHHRFLGHEALGLPLLAYFAEVHVKNGPWDELHAAQKKNKSGPASGSWLESSWQTANADRQDAIDPDKASRRANAMTKDVIKHEKAMLRVATTEAAVNHQPKPTTTGDKTSEYNQGSHKIAGEAHLAAAEAQHAAGNEPRAAEHRAQAAEHAKDAGGAWDEAKHPRDENGKFDAGEFNESDHPRAKDGKFGSGDGESGAHKALFDPKKTEGLPKTVQQKEKSKDAIFSQAKQAHEQALDMLDRGKGLDKDIGAKTIRGDQMTSEQRDKALANIASTKGPVVVIAPMKTTESAERKVASDYNGDHSKLTDLVRSSVAVDSMDQVHEVVKHLEERGMKLAKQPGDRFAKPTEAGYRDLMLKVEYPNGHVGEIQVHLKSMLAAKEQGHKFYDVTRTLEPKMKDRSMTKADWKTFDTNNRAMRTLYGNAWKSAGGKADAGDFDEEKHPRGPDGKFGEGGGESGAPKGSSAAEKASAEASRMSARAAHLHGAYGTHKEAAAAHLAAAAAQHAAGNEAKAAEHRAMAEHEAGGKGDPQVAEGLQIKTAKAADFHKAFSEAFKGSPFADHVTHYTPEQLKGMKLYTTADGKAGVAVHDHGDGRIEATALFNSGGAKGAGLGLLQHAIDHAGVNYVECYGPKLNQLYAGLGFKVDSKSAFEPKYAAKTWDSQRFDSPDYYTMRLPSAYETISGSGL
jgi:uncharacterized protein